MDGYIYEYYEYDSPYTMPVAMVSDTRTDQISVQNIVPVIYFADENETGIIYALDTKNS